MNITPLTSFQIEDLEPGERFVDAEGDTLEVIDRPWKLKPSHNIWNSAVITSGKNSCKVVETDGEDPLGSVWTSLECGDETQVV